MELPSRKPNRLKDFDYSSPGAYFVTICTQNKRHLFSHVVVGAIHESPALRLTEYGKIVEQMIRQTADRFVFSTIQYVIMPNHVHLLVSIEQNAKGRAIRESPLPPRSTISKAIGYFKMQVSKEIHKLCPSESVWQRSFHDRVVRGEAEYAKLWNYIETNPARWREDCFYTENG